MKIKIDNTYYPKPLLYFNSNDFINNRFTLNIDQQDYDKANNKLEITVNSSLDNKFILNEITNSNIVPLIHIEQKSIRYAEKLNINGLTKINLNLNNFSTTDTIEIVGVLFCSKSFRINDLNELNPLYSVLSNNIEYERGYIVGYSTSCSIDLPEDKRIGSIFSVIPDVENTLNGTPYRISLNNELLQIIINGELHNEYISIYSKDPGAKRLIFSTLVYPALFIAMCSLFSSYEAYKNYKWCRTISIKIKSIKKEDPENLFKEELFDTKTISEYVHIVADNLFKDGIEFYKEKLDAEVM